MVNGCPLTSNIPLSYLEDGSYFSLNETKYLLLNYGTEFDGALASTAGEYLRETVEYWRIWIKHSSIAGFYNLM